MQIFFRDSRIGPIGGGNEIQRKIIAHMIGLDA